MSKITVTTTPKNRISINTQQKNQIQSVTSGGGNGVRELKKLLDVDASAASQNDTLVYDEATGKYVVRELPVVRGGTF